jgi:hypothetical protein
VLSDAAAYSWIERESGGRVRPRADGTIERMVLS